MDNRVVIYRSISEQRQDDFWWSEGYITATKSGDAIIIGVILVVGIFIFAKIFGK